MWPGAQQPVGGSGWATAGALQVFCRDVFALVARGPGPALGSRPAAAHGHPACANTVTHAARMLQGGRRVGEAGSGWMKRARGAGAGHGRAQGTMLARVRSGGSGGPRSCASPAPRP